MLSCKEATRLVSEKLDRKLPFWRRLGVRLHVLMCRACSRYAHQIEALDDAVSRRYRSSPPVDDLERLPNEALQRIKTSLHPTEPDSDSQIAE